MDARIDTATGIVTLPETSLQSYMVGDIIAIGTMKYVVMSPNTMKVLHEPMVYFQEPWSGDFGNDSS